MNNFCIFDNEKEKSKTIIFDCPNDIFDKAVNDTFLLGICLDTYLNKSIEYYNTLIADIRGVNNNEV